MTATGRPNRLTHEEAALRLGVGKSTLARMRMQGTGPEYLKIGGRVWYEPAEIVDWLGKQRRTQTDQHRKTSPTSGLPQTARPVG